MNAYLIALGAALGLACLRLAATQIESAYYFFQNGEHAKARRCLLRASSFVLVLALILTPVVRLFNSFEVLTIETPAIEHSPKGSNGVRV